VVPVGRVGRVSFLAMKIGMDPGARLAFILLRGLVSFRPIAFGVPPQAGQRQAKPSRWFIPRQ